MFGLVGSFSHFFFEKIKQRIIEKVYLGIGEKRNNKNE